MTSPPIFLPFTTFAKILSNYMYVSHTTRRIALLYSGDVGRCLAGFSMWE